jgi:hypothetical protein
VQFEEVRLVDDDRNSLLLVYRFEFLSDLALIVRYLLLTLVFLVSLTFYYSRGKLKESVTYFLV